MALRSDNWADTQAAAKAEAHRTVDCRPDIVADSRIRCSEQPENQSCCYSDKMDRASFRSRLVVDRTDGWQTFVFKII